MKRVLSIKSRSLPSIIQVHILERDTVKCIRCYRVKVKLWHYLLAAKRSSTTSHHWARFTRTLTLKWQEMRPGAGGGPCPPLTRLLLELPAVCDSDLLGGSPVPWTERLHFLDHVQSLLHAAKHNMHAVQPEWRNSQFIITAPCGGAIRDAPSRVGAAAVCWVMPRFLRVWCYF